ncbi:M28 family peptidase [candidate division KSB1 bacterium]|nr:M28 family peptidase [candidate division KSB1 bacterium]
MKYLIRNNTSILSRLLIFAIFYTANCYSQDLYLKKYLNIISIDSLKSHTSYLGSDDLLGRATGTLGERKAWNYIAAQLSKYQIRPYGDNGTYFQAVPMHGSRPLPNSLLTLFSAGRKHEFKLQRDYLLYRSGAQTFIPKPLPLVFVGYGIIAPEYDYSDYKSVDVVDKIVVFLSGEPPSTDSTFFDGIYPTIYSFPDSKQRIAISQGARGSIMIPAAIQNQDKTWYDWVNEFAFEDVTLAYSVSSNLSVVMNPNAARRLFARADYGLNQILRMNRSGDISSFPLRTAISFNGDFEQREFIGNNVVGFLKGENATRKNTTVILSAHYDHLGIGRAVKGDSIYNGVVDNAIGVAALLECARAFGFYPLPPAHNVLFLFVTAEEKGLLGSQFYLDHPYIPLDKTIANVNIDGLSIFDRVNSVIGIGAQLSTLGELLTSVTSMLDLGVSRLPNQFIEFESLMRSDQIAFAQAGIPSILIAEGVDYVNISTEDGINNMIHWFENIYHTPFDDINQQINWDSARQHCQIIFAYAMKLANVKQLPEWKSGTDFSDYGQQ